jgi:hypothetical protein
MQNKRCQDALNDDEFSEMLHKPSLLPYCSIDSNKFSLLQEDMQTIQAQC